MVGALFLIVGGGWGIILVGGVDGALFWVGGGGWGIILVGWG